MPQRPTSLRPTRLRPLPVLTALTLSLAVTLAGCGDQTSTAEDPADEPGTTALGSLAGEHLADPPPLAPWGDGGTTIRFTVHEDRISVVADCNTHTGGGELVDGVLRVDQLASTEIGCEAEAEERDRWLVSFLDSDPAVAEENGALVLTGTVDGAEVDLVLRRSSGQQDAAVALTDRTWRLVATTVDGAASPVPDGVEASVLVTGDQLTVLTGCNTGTSVVEVLDGALRLDGLATTRRGCPPEAAPVERAVLTVLQGEVEVTLEGRTLTLGRGADSLEFSAD